MAICVICRKDGAEAATRPDVPEFVYHWDCVRCPNCGETEILWKCIKHHYAFKCVKPGCGYIAICVDGKFI